MPWYIWFVVGSLAFQALGKVVRVGEPRKPIEGSEAAAVVLLNGMFIIMIIAAVTS